MDSFSNKCHHESWLKFKSKVVCNLCDNAVEFETTQEENVSPNLLNESFRITEWLKETSYHDENNQGVVAEFTSEWSKQGGCLEEEVTCEDLKQDEKSPKEK